MREKITEFRTMFPVVSSQLSSIGYDSKEKELYITFQRGMSYIYLKVPETEFYKLKNAESVGEYFSKFIKGKYEFKKI